MKTMKDKCRHHIWKVAGGKHYASVSERCKCEGLKPGDVFEMDEVFISPFLSLVVEQPK